MGNMPISAHITVVSTTPAAIPDAGPALPSGAAGSAEGADFSNLLAGQIAAKMETLPSGSSQPVAEGTASDQADSDAAASGAGLAVVGFIPLTSLPIATVQGGRADGDKALSRLESGRGLAEIQAEKDGAAHRAVIGGDAGKSADTPANLAAQPASLPAKTLAETVRDESLAGERGLKLAARPEVSDANATERSPGLMVHPSVASKSEAVASNQPVQAPAVAIESRIGAPGWGAELGQKVVWLANQQQQVAQINVTPPQLGPIEIRLNLASDQASAIFVSPHAAVRDAIEAALPRLREMLAESGLTLGNVDVSAHSSGHPQQGQAQGGDHPRSLAPTFADAHRGEAVLRIGALPGATRGGQGLVDIFA